MGTELAARGVRTALPLWSASALVEAPEVVAAIHRDYAAAHATVHTTNTFRTRRRTMGAGWLAATERAVQLARANVPSTHRVAGSISPLEDCYRPDKSPTDPRPEHREMARALAQAGVDIVLCETFPHAGEALVAVEEAVASGLPTWVAFTAGPDADLMSPEAMGRAARAAVERGASAVLVNCVPAVHTLRFVEALASAGVPFGAYANAGAADGEIGFRPTALEGGAARYAALAREWMSAGATLLGGCCGTGPEHIAAVAALVETDGSGS